MSATGLLTPTQDAPAGLNKQVATERGSLTEIAATAGFVMLVCYAMMRSISQALVKPFWYDEICTVLMVKQENLTTLWSAVKEGADGQPLPFYLLERVAAATIPTENLAFRGVSIVAFVIILSCIYIAVKTRKGAVIGLICATIPLVTILFEMLSVEARPYSLLAACIAFALICYQRVPVRRWVILLGLSLELAEFFHYLAVFALLPFFAAETVYFAKNKEFRGQVWIALSSAFVPLALFWPIISKTQKLFGAHFWAKPTFSAAIGSYSWYFLLSETSWGMYLVALAALAVLFTTLATLRRTSRLGDGNIADSPIHELVLVLGLLSLPFVGFAVAAVTHGGMTAKYLVPSLLGFPLALGFSFPTLRRWNFILPAAAAVLLLSALIHQERQFWATYSRKFVSPAKFVEDLVQNGGHEDLPVVISDTHDFMALQHYASESWRKRFIILLDADQAVKYTGSDTGDRQLAILRQYADLPAYDFQKFLGEHPMFLLYSSNGGLDRDWWPGRLKKDGFKLQNVSVRPVESHDYLHRVVLVSR